MENKNEKIIEILENLDDYEKLEIYNEYNDYDYIYTMDNFDEIMSNATPTKIAMKIFYGDFRPNDNYFMFDGYENLESFDYLDDKIDYEEIAKYIIDNDEDFDNDEIREILDEDKEDEE